MGDDYFAHLFGAFCFFFVGLCHLINQTKHTNNEKTIFYAIDSRIRFDGL